MLLILWQVAKCACPVTSANIALVHTCKHSRRALQWFLSLPRPRLWPICALHIIKSKIPISSIKKILLESYVKHFEMILLTSLEIVRLTTSKWVEKVKGRKGRKEGRKEVKISIFVCVFQSEKRDNEEIDFLYLYTC